MLTEIILTVVVLGLGLLFKWLNTKFAASKAIEDAEQALLLGVQHVQATYVDAIKKAKEDGTLTDEEKKTAKDQAIEAAKTIASNEGYKVLSSWGSEKLSGLVELALAKIRR